MTGWAPGLSEAMLGEGPWQPLGDLGFKYMRTIKASSTHLASLIRDILDAAAASHGSLAIQLQKVVPCRLCLPPTLLLSLFTAAEPNTTKPLQAHWQQVHAQPIAFPAQICIDK